MINQQAQFNREQRELRMAERVAYAADPSRVMPSTESTFDDREPDLGCGVDRDGPVLPLPWAGNRKRDRLARRMRSVATVLADVAAMLVRVSVAIQDE